MNAWDSFLKEVKEKKAELGNPEELWFRGHNDASYELQPSLFRYTNGMGKEQLLFEKFAQAKARDSKGQTEWDILVEMQHYGIPTRLLDWTEVLGIAVFFAYSEKGIDGCIWLLEPKLLNASSKGGTLVNLSEDGYNYKELYWQGKPVKPTQTIAAYCNYYNDRIASQKGNFTIHASDAPLESNSPPYLRKVILPAAAMSDAKEFLYHAGINEFRVFPDIVGLAPHLRSIVNLREKPKRTTKKIVITLAEYGAKSTYKNVTMILNGKVADGELDIIANNGLFGDPIPGVPKELKVDFTIDGHAGSIIIPEDKPLKLPSPHSLN